jgi:hypothetical protein
VHAPASLINLILMIMKKILLLLSMVFTLNCLNAQDSGSAEGKKIYIGGKVGYGIVNFESMSASVNNFAERTFDNLSFGFVAGYKVLLSGFAVQIEGNYATYKANNIIPTYIYSPGSPILQSSGLNSKVDHVDMTLNTIDIPLTINYSLSSGTLAPFIYAGVNWGINMSASSTIVRAITLGETSYSTFYDDITPRIKTNEFAPIAGGGIRLRIGTLTFIGDVRYKYGVSNLSNINNGFTFKNNAFWFSGGLVLFL